MQTQCRHRTREKASVYSPDVKSSNIHYRVFLCLILIGTNMILSECVIKGINYGVPQNIYNCVHLFLTGYSTGELHQSCTLSYPDIHATQTWNESSHILFPHFHERILLLSSDIEMNPGPISDTNDILQAISSCKADLLQEIRFVKSDIHCIKEEIST